MHIPEDESYEEVGLLEFQLANEMGQLATLQQLDSLHDEYAPQMGRDEILWMLNTWKKLKIIYGILHATPSEDRRLKDALELFGVHVVGSTQTIQESLTE
jgi:hypothetical protein